MIYFIQNGNQNLVKIGSSANPEQRLRRLQTGNPESLQIIGLMRGDSWKEREIQDRFARLKTSIGGDEWYVLDEELSGYISRYKLSSAGEKLERLSSEFVVVTPEQAEIWLENCRYEKQRALRSNHVSLLASEMEKGRFRPTAQVSFAILNGHSVLINGQHTLNAIVRSGIEQPINVVKHKVYSSDDIAELYFSYDIHKRRTFGEIAAVFDVPQKTGLSRSQVTRLGAGVRFIEAKFTTRRGVSPPLIDQAKLCIEYGEAAYAYFAAISGPVEEIAKKLLRKATVAIGLVTFRYASLEYGTKRVEEFWYQVARDDGIRRDDPRKVAHNHLHHSQMPSGRGLVSGKVCDADYSARYLASCWNAWIEGRSLTKTSVKDPRAPIAILGTPFTSQPALSTSVAQ